MEQSLRCKDEPADRQAQIERLVLLLRRAAARIRQLEAENRDCRRNNAPAARW